MTTAVLKNRILSLTGGEFEESQYGATSFTDFLSKHGNAIRLDDASFPPIVKLLRDDQSDVEPTASQGGGPGTRIRSDLWLAILDYASGNTYVWDEDTSLACPSQPGDHHPLIPTITLADQQVWGADFINTHATHSEMPGADRQRLSDWHIRTLGTNQLPVSLRPAWNRYLRRRVIQSLLEWLDSHDIEPPSDVSITVEQISVPQDEAEALRQFVLRVVQQMDAHELAGISLPPLTVMRVTRLRR